MPPNPYFASAENIAAIFSVLRAQNPEPKTELDYRNDYTLLVAVVLSAQATDIGVNKATKGLFDAADNPRDMLALGEEGVKAHIKTIGLFNAKARHVIGLSKALLDNFGGAVPRDLKSLQSLPGVGGKTARCDACLLNAHCLYFTAQAGGGACV